MGVEATELWEKISEKRWAGGEREKGGRQQGNRFLSLIRFSLDV